MTVHPHPTAARSRTDEELVRQVRTGHPAAFEAVVTRYQAALTGFARGLLGGGHHDAEEAVQDTFVRALAALRRPDDRELLLKPWLYTICRNACLDRLRRSAAGRRPVELELVAGGLADRSADPHRQAVGREELAALVHELQALPARQRAALLGLEVEGRTHEALAAELDVSVGASKALVCRARRQLVAARAAA